MDADSLMDERAELVVSELLKKVFFNLMSF